MMKKIGVTGGIGSGKSALCALLAVWGVPVYRTDDRAKELMEADPRLRKQIVDLFGGEAYAGGGLNRKFLADRVFRDPALLAALDGVVHPAVRKDFETWFSQQKAPYVVMECAILFESGFDALVDRIVTVSAPVETRVERAARRDGCQSEKIRERIARQMDDRERESRSDYVILNTTLDALRTQAEALHQTLLHENR